MFAKTIGDATATIDPLDHYKNYASVAEACGPLIGWLLVAAEAPAPIHETAAGFYQYFMGWHTDDKATVEGDLFLYPGDPPLYPLFKIERHEETVLIYPHSIVAVVEDGELTKWSRFD